MVRLKTFSAAFITTISQPHFGERFAEAILPGTLSPGAEELKEKGIAELLRRPVCLRQMHSVVKEYDRLMKEQEVVHEVTRQVRPVITKLFNAQRTLATIKKRIQQLEVDLRFGPDPAVQGPSAAQKHLYKAIEELERCEDELQRSEQLHSSTLHPTARLPGHKTSPWKILIADYDYDLDTLRNMAPRNWAIEQLDHGLRERFRSIKMKVSDLTRYRIIAAVFEAGGLDRIDPVTIKQYFADKAKRTSARKFPTS